MVHVAVNKYDFEKIYILEYAFGEGGHQKAYAFINVDNCERLLNKRTLIEGKKHAPKVGGGGCMTPGYATILCLNNTSICLPDTRQGLPGTRCSLLPV